MKKYLIEATNPFFIEKIINGKAHLLDQHKKGLLKFYKIYELKPVFKKDLLKK